MLAEEKKAMADELEAARELISERNAQIEESERKIADLESRLIGVQEKKSWMEQDLAEWQRVQERKDAKLQEAQARIQEMDQDYGECDFEQYMTVFTSKDWDDLQAAALATAETGNTRVFAQSLNYIVGLRHRSTPQQFDDVTRGSGRYTLDERLERFREYIRLKALLRQWKVEE